MRLILRALLVLVVLAPFATAASVEPLVLTSEWTCEGEWYSAEGERCEASHSIVGARAAAAGEDATATVGSTSERHHGVDAEEDRDRSWDAETNQYGVGARTSQGSQRVDLIRCSHGYEVTTTSEGNAWELRHDGAERCETGLLLSGAIAADIVLLDCGATYEAHGRGTGGFGYGWFATDGEMTGDDFDYRSTRESWCFHGVRAAGSEIGYEEGTRREGWQGPGGSSYIEDGSSRILLP